MFITWDDLILIAMSDYELGASIPSNPGPNALGHTAVLGSVRRENGIPVVRDEVVDAIDDLEAVDVPDNPVLPILSLE